jgi:hypothetical protein
MASPVVVKDSGTIAADAVEDQAWLECASEEIAHLGSVNDKALRYVAERPSRSTDNSDCAYFKGFQPFRPLLLSHGTHPHCALSPRMR